MSFTPGPWKLDHSGGATYVCTAESDISLCRVSAHDQIANANLIAAAPDMLAALQKSEKWVAMYLDLPGHEAAASSMLAVIRRALGGVE